MTDQCARTHSVLGRRPKFDRDYRCMLPLGHDGEHVCGSVRWPAATFQPAPLFSTRLTMLKLLGALGEKLTELELFRRIDGGLRLDDVANRVVVALDELKSELRTLKNSEDLDRLVLRDRVELMEPVVEAALTWYANGVDPDGKFAKALSDAVEDYEQQTQRFEGVA